jgi:hypothetical protein
MCSFNSQANWRRSDSLFRGCSFLPDERSVRKFKPNPQQLLFSFLFVNLTGYLYQYPSQKKKKATFRVHQFSSNLFLEFSAFEVGRFSEKISAEYLTFTSSIKIEGDKKGKLKASA